MTGAGPYWPAHTISATSSICELKWKFYNHDLFYCLFGACTSSLLFVLWRRSLHNLKENILVPVLGFICLIDLKWKGKFTFLQVYFPFTVLTVNYKVGCYLLSHNFVSIIFFLLLHFTFCFNNCCNVNYLVLGHQLTTSLFRWSHIVR